MHIEHDNTTMSTRKRLVVSGLTGLAISVLGLGFVSIGGYGPCGPASMLATIGSVLGYWHFVGLCILIPPLEKWLSTGIHIPWLSMCINFTGILLVPATTWSLLIFGILTLRHRINASRRELSRKSETCEPDARP